MGGLRERERERERDAVATVISNTAQNHMHILMVVSTTKMGTYKSDGAMHVETDPGCRCC